MEHIIVELHKELHKHGEAHDPGHELAQMHALGATHAHGLRGTRADGMSASSSPAAEREDELDSQSHRDAFENVKQEHQDNIQMMRQVMEDIGKKDPLTPTPT